MKGQFPPRPATGTPPLVRFAQKGEADLSRLWELSAQKGEADLCLLPLARWSRKGNPLSIPAFGTGIFS
jgi:hypothetical protein